MKIRELIKKLKDEHDDKEEVFALWYTERKLAMFLRNQSAFTGLSYKELEACAAALIQLLGEEIWTNNPEHRCDIGDYLDGLIAQRGPEIAERYRRKGPPRKAGPTLAPRDTTGRNPKDIVPDFKVIKGGKDDEAKSPESPEGEAKDEVDGAAGLPKAAEDPEVTSD